MVVMPIELQGHVTFKGNKQVYLLRYLNPEYDHVQPLRDNKYQMRYRINNLLLFLCSVIGKLLHSKCIKECKQVNLLYILGREEYLTIMHQTRNIFSSNNRWSNSAILHLPEIRNWFCVPLNHTARTAITAVPVDRRMRWLWHTVVGAKSAIARIVVTAMKLSLRYLTMYYYLCALQLTAAEKPTPYAPIKPDTSGQYFYTSIFRRRKTDSLWMYRLVHDIILNSLGSLP